MSWFFREVRFKNELIPTVCHTVHINRPVSEVIHFPISRQGIGVRKVGSGGWGRETWGRGIGVPDRDANPPPRSPSFSKLPTPTSLHTLRVKSSLCQIVLTSNRLCVRSLTSSLFASNRPRQIVIYPVWQTLFASHQR